MDARDLALECFAHDERILQRQYAEKAILLAAAMDLLCDQALTIKRQERVIASQRSELRQRMGLPSLEDIQRDYDEETDGGHDPL